MKPLNLLLIIAILTLLSSCNPKISTRISKSYSTLEYNQDVVVIGLNRSMPDNTEVIGRVRIGDTGFTTRCSFEIVIDKAKLEARKVGGNAIKITKHNPPTIFWSSCHRITAEILKVEDIEAYKSKSIDSTLLDADFAILHVYRNSSIGALLNYDLYLGDTILCRVTNRFRKSIKVKRDGYNTLWAITETKKELPVTIEFGQEYYIRCGITMGVLVGRPSLEIVDNVIGKLEFDAVKIQKSNKRDLLILKDGREIVCVINDEDDENIHISIFRDGKKIDTKVRKDRIQKIERAD